MPSRAGQEPPDLRYFKTPESEVTRNVRKRD